MESIKSRKVRYAVVGLGDVPAFEHAKESSELVARVSSDYDQLERVIRDEHVDAVYVAAPSSLHREMTERAARAGANVLCEKPMATSVADCEAMIQACEDNGVKLMIAYRLHFEASNLRALERVSRGDIGEPRLFSSIFTRDVREGEASGALLDLGIYCVNAARYVFGAEPMSVVAMQTAGTEERFRHVDETTSVIMRFPGDRLAQFAVSQGASNVSEFRVIGTKGDIDLDPAFELSTRSSEVLTVDGATLERRGKRKDQLAPEIIHFSSCILEDRAPQPSGEEGLADMRVIEAIVRSAATREVVHLGSERNATRKPRAAHARTVQAR